jgi:hypothetical protein
MIIDGILNLVYGFISLVITPITSLADVTMSSSFSSSINTANGYLSSFNNFIPMDTLGQILVIFVAIELAIIIYKLIMWVVRRIPTQS